MIDDTNYEEQTQEVTQDQTQEQTPQQEESYQAYNFRMMRERQKELEEELYNSRREAEDLRRSVQQASEPAIDPDAADIDDEDYISGKKYKTHYQKLNQKYNAVASQLEEFKQQSIQQQSELKLQAELPNFNQIVTKENLEKLAAKKPTVYQSIINSPNIYQAGKAAYEALEDFIPTGKFAKEDQKIQENKLKPRAAASMPNKTDSVLHNYGSSILTDERKAEIMKISRAYRRGY